ncbi:hypothetical protein [Streptomyces griseosporeus]|uniref:hypothetical protein n=1 Tax=Streptomyces griseosporeus TaxID=1910 RepID=UPI0036F8A3CA
MPITATYTVRCDTCDGVMDGDYPTPEAAAEARRILGWDTPGGGTACPDHNPRPPACPSCSAPTVRTPGRWQCTACCWTDPA